MRKGREYEDIATEYIKSIGYRVVARNYHCMSGEIDIIAFDGDELVFVEVKGAKGSEFGHPSERLTEKKLRRILDCAHMYMEKVSFEGSYRVDLITVVRGKIEHTKNIGFF